MTNDRTFAARLRRLRYHGKQDGVFLEPGYNSQMSSLTAAVLDIKHKRQAVWAVRRREVAKVYDRALDRMGWKRPSWDEGVIHARHKYVFLAPDRDRLRAHLSARGVPTMIHYATPFHDEPIFAAYADDRAAYPQASAFTRATLSLPINGHLADDEVAQIVDALETFEADPESATDAAAKAPTITARHRALSPGDALAASGPAAGS